MADNNVFITGAASGALSEALTGLPEWATEATLKRIETVLRKSAVSADQTAKILKALAGKQLSAAEMQKLNEEMKQYQKNLKDANRQRKRDNEEDAKNADTRKKYRQQEYQSLTTSQKVLGTLASMAMVIKGVYEENIKTFDDLYASGVNVVGGFDNVSNGFEGLQQIAIQTGVRYTELSATMQKYSSAVNVVGAANFAKTIRSSSTELKKFGFDAKQSGELLGQYLDIQQGYSEIGSKSQQQMTEDLTNFGKKVTGLSMATGIAKNKLLENVAAMSKSIEATILNSQVGGAAAENTLMFVNSFKDQKVGQAFLRMMTDTIKPLNTTFQNFQKLGMGGFGQKMMAFVQSTKGLDPGEAMKRTVRFARTNEAEMNKMVKQANLYRQAGMEAEANAVMELVTGLRQQAAAYKDYSEADMEKMQKASEASKGLSTAIEKLKSRLQILFSPLTLVIEGITMALDVIMMPLEKLAENFPKFTSGLGAAIFVIGGLVAVVGLLRSKLASLIAYWLKGGGGAAGGAAGGLAGKAGGGVGALGGGVGKGIGALGEGFGKLLSSVGTGGGKLIEGIMTGIANGIGAFANPKIIIGAAILSGSLILIAAGVGVSAVIIGKSLPYLAEGIKSFADIDGENLLSVAKGIAALGGALALFGAGSVMGSVGSVFSNMVDGIGSFFGAKSPIEKFKEFASMGPGLEIAATAINSLASGLANFASVLNNLKLDSLSGLVENINKIEISKALAFAAIGAIGSFATASPRAPASTSLSSPSKVASSDGVQEQATPKETTGALGPGIEKQSGDTSLANMMATQNALLEQLLHTSDKILSTNADILKYTRVKA